MKSHFLSVLLFSVGCIGFVCSADSKMPILEPVCLAWRGIRLCQGNQEQINTKCGVPKTDDEGHPWPKTWWGQPYDRPGCYDDKAKKIYAVKGWMGAWVISHEGRHADGYAHPTLDGYDWERWGVITIGESSEKATSGTVIPNGVHVKHGPSSVHPFYRLISNWFSLWIN